MPYAIYVSAIMITLYSYPTLFGVADNNGYGLKVFAFMRLAGLPFVHEHIFDASAAPRGQLPYIVDDGETVGDSETIIAHLIGKHRLTIDAALGARERDLSLLVTRLLDDLYWVMSYSRWKDERYWPAFRAAFMHEHPSLTEEGLAKAREFNFQRYHFQGIGRYAPDAAYERGLAEGATVLGEGLKRNLYGTLAAPAGDHVAALASYVEHAAALLGEQPVDRLLAGEVAFPAEPAPP